jgi:hypothetical protein
MNEYLEPFIDILVLKMIVTQLHNSSNVFFLGQSNVLMDICCTIVPISMVSSTLSLSQHLLFNVLNSLPCSGLNCVSPTNSCLPRKGEYEFVWK